MRAASAAETLTRETVVRAGLALLDREGAAALSVRRLAAELGVTPMALYNHVRDKSDLLDAIAAEVVEGIVYPAPSRPWRARISGCFRALRAACLAHPAAVPLIESADALPQAVHAPMKHTVDALTREGVPAEDAVRAFYLLITFTLGQVGYQARGWGRGVDPTARFPHVTRTAAGRPWDWDASFEFGLKCILDGIEAQS